MRNGSFPERKWTISLAWILTRLHFGKDVVRMDQPGDSNRFPYVRGFLMEKGVGK